MRSFIICNSSPDIAKMAKSRRTRWLGHGACMGEMRNLRGKYHVGDLDVDGTVTAKTYSKETRREGVH
jgi:hypothetical protein